MFKKIFYKLKAVLRVFQAFKNLWASIKSGLSLLSMPWTWGAFFLVAAFVLYSVVTDYQALRNAVDRMQSAFSSSKSQVVAPPGIETSVTKDDPEWMSKYCREQSAAFPPAPFKYEKKETYEKAKGDPAPPTEIGRRMPKDAKGNEPDSLTCGFVYKYDDEEAFASVGIAYKFDINAFNEFYERADNLHTHAMNATWKKISLLSNKEAGRPFNSYEGYPLLFMRENPVLGTIEYASMHFAVDYYVLFTIFEKPK